MAASPASPCTSWMRVCSLESEAVCHLGTECQIAGMASGEKMSLAETLAEQAESFLWLGNWEPP